MTTQTPYQPTPPRTPDSYPTAPPWAPAEPPAASPPGQPGPGWAGMPYTPHGQLMVKYPQAMQDATRPKAPAVWPVVILTLLFGLFGAISAARRATRAGQTRSPKAPYWVAFGATTVVGLVAWAVVASIAVPVLLALRQTMVTESLQDHLVNDGQVKTPTGTTVTAAKCTRAADLSTYACVLTLSNGKSATVKVTATTDGAWTLGK